MRFDLNRAVPGPIYCICVMNYFFSLSSSLFYIMEHYTGSYAWKHIAYAMAVFVHVQEGLGPSTLSNLHPTRGIHEKYTKLNATWEHMGSIKRTTLTFFNKHSRSCFQVYWTDIIERVFMQLHCSISPHNRAKYITLLSSFSKKSNY